MLAGICALAGACGPDDGEGSPRLRGDRAFARGDYEDALAEYRLSMREEPGVAGMLRVAHAYATLGRVDEARALYDEAVREDSVHAEQAVSDFVARAKQAFANGDSYGMASAMETAVHFRPGLVVEELVLPMARQYSNAGEHGRAQPLYLRALGSERRDPDVVFEAALAHKEIGDCERAMEFFAEMVELAPRRERETRWHVGSCALQLAREMIAQGTVDNAVASLQEELADTLPPGVGDAGDEWPPGTDAEWETAGGTEGLAGAEGLAGVEGVELSPDQVLREVFRYLDLVLDLNEPRAMVPEAYFQKADILARVGECEAAVAAYRMVPEVDVSGSGNLVRRARERVDQIRFGDGDGPC